MTSPENNLDKGQAKAMLQRHLREVHGAVRYEDPHDQRTDRRRTSGPVRSAATATPVPPNGSTSRQAPRLRQRRDRLPDELADQ